MTHLLEKDTPFMFSKDCIDAFETLKKKLTEASILVVPDWNLPFELMCDASDFAIGAILGQPGGTFMQKTPEECYKSIENMTAHHNHWNTSAIRDETSRNISSTSTTESPEVVRQLEMINKNFSKMMRQFKTIKAVDTKYREPETITDQVLTESTNNVPPLVVHPTPASTSFSTNSSSKMPEVTKDMVQPSTENIQPLVAQKQNLIYEPLVTPKPKLTIPYPSRVNKQKLREKDYNLALKFVEIFRNLHFELSFADALLHMPKFALMFKTLLNNKEKLFDLAITPVNEKCSAVILKKLPEKLRDPDERPFLRTRHALIDVYGDELTLIVDDEAITFKVGQTSKYSYSDAESINRVDVIDVACEEYVQEVLGFFDNSKSGNPTTISDPIIALSSHSLTPFEGGDFILEEIEAYLTSESISPGIDDTDLDLEGDIRLLEELLNNDPSLSPLPPKELNIKEIKTVKSSIDEPLELELKELPSHLEYAYLEGTDKLPIARPMNYLLKKETPFVFSKDCIDAFETLKKKLTEAPILVVPDWNLPFELICDASDFAIGTVLGQRKTKHFQPVHYASKIMTEAQIHYTTTEKEMPAVVYAFEKFWPYLVLSKRVVYMDHSALKYILNKQDAKPRLIQWVFLLQEFDIIIRDKKGTENLAADNLSRL
nr:reverse transcriptase domain-containing protein [Tanacetum cinerariifolium]